MAAIAQAGPTQTPHSSTANPALREMLEHRLAMHPVDRRGGERQEVGVADDVDIVMAGDIQIDDAGMHAPRAAAEPQHDAGVAQGQQPGGGLAARDRATVVAVVEHGADPPAQAGSGSISSGPLLRTEPTEGPTR
jgi:hypothetical protein